MRTEAKIKITNDWNFDKIVDRRHTGSVKWKPDILRAKFGKAGEDFLAM